MNGLREGIDLWITTPRRRLAVVELVGECDLYDAPRLRLALEEASATSGGDLCVDLSRLRFLDSACLQELLKARRRHRARSTRFVLVAPSDEVRRTLATARLDRRFAIMPPLDVDQQGTPRPAPRTTSPGSISRTIFRSVNEQILEMSSSWSDNHELHLFCECPAPACMRPVAILRDEYEKVRATRGHLAVAATHRDDSSNWAVLRRAAAYLVVAAP